MESDTSPHVLRFTGSTTGASAAAWSKPSSPTLRGDGEVSGSGVSEGVSEAPTFTEWSTMVVPTYPEGGSHALLVCQHHHQVVRVRTVRPPAPTAQSPESQDAIMSNVAISLGSN